MLPTTRPPSLLNSQRHSTVRDIKPTLRPEENKRRLEEALWHKERSHFERAAEIYEDLAKQDVAEAQYFYGVLLSHGLGVEQDQIEAFRLLTAAAAQGILVANTGLGILYVMDQSIPKDYFKAEQYFLKAKDDPEALMLLGEIYRSSDEAKALYYFQRSAGSGNAAACTTLSEIYRGQHKLKDAMFYAKQAASLGAPAGGALYAVASVMSWHGGEITADRDESLRDEPSSDEVNTDESSDEVREWNSVREEAVYLARRAIETSTVQGLYILEALDETNLSPKYEKYYKSLPVHWDIFTGWGKLYNHFKLAARNNDPIAMYNLGMMNLEGRGTPKDLAMALAWLEEACQSGDISAQRQLSILLKRGNAEYFVSDIISCYQKAAQQKEPWALYRFGSKYLREGDLGSALKHFDEAEMAGSKKARLKIEKILNGDNEAEKKEIKSESIKSGAGFIVENPFHRTDPLHLFVIRHIVAEKKKEPWSIYRLGTLYLAGCGVQKDFARALKYLGEAEALGVRQSRDALIQAKEQALCKSSGVFRFFNPQDLKETIKQFKIAGEAGSATAKFIYLELSAEHGNTDAMFQLGKTFFDGNPYLDIRQDLKKSETYFKNAADKGHPGAASQLSVHYGIGTFTSSNPDAKSLKYAQIAAKNCSRFVKENVPD